MTELKITTYFCGECGYHMPTSINPYSETFIAKYRGVQPGGCPSCATHPVLKHRKHSQLSQATDLADLTTTKTASDATLEATQVEDTDNNGIPIMEHTGTTLKVGIVNGKPAVVEVPVYEPKMRDLTDDELATLKRQRDKNLDDLEKVAV